METFLTYLFYSLGAAVLIIPLCAPILKKIKVPRPKNLKNRVNNVTNMGWTVIGLAIVLIPLSIYREHIDSEKDDLAEKKQLSAERQRIVSERRLQKKLDYSYKQQQLDANRHALELSKHGVHLSQMAIAEMNYMTALQKNLDSWGLTISDSLIVKQKGNPLIIVSDFILDTLGKSPHISARIWNTGSTEAFDVSVKFYNACCKDDENAYSSEIENVGTLDIGPGMYETLGKQIDKKDPNIFKYFYVYGGTYNDGHGNQKEFMGVFEYNASLKQWVRTGLNPIEP